MASNSDEQNMVTAKTETTDTKAASLEAATWQLNALTEALGDLTLNVNDSLSVGRGSDNDVVLGSKQVSRNHALLSVLNGKLYVKDLDSSNGTFINDARIEGNKSERLKADDTVGFASFAFQVTVPIAADASLAPVTQSLDNAEADVKSADIEQPVAEEVSDVEVNDIDIANNEITDAETIDADIVEPSLTKESKSKTKSKSEIVAEPMASTDTESSRVEVEHAEPSMDSPVEPVVVEETVLENTSLENIADHQATENVMPDSDGDNKATDTAAEPVVKETIVEDVLSSTASDSAPITLSPATPSTAVEQEPVVSDEPSTETLTKEPIAAAPIAKNPVTPSEPTSDSEAPVSETTAPEHDKTTKTELQQEVDPDVLRAEQAATGQLSGTANLGQAPDIGTEGNNAMDQTINNPADAGHVEKKSSGGWFIWVFIAIIIIGLALWLFNMGS